MPVRSSRNGCNLAGCKRNPFASEYNRYPDPFQRIEARDRGEVENFPVGTEMS